MKKSVNTIIMHLLVSILLLMAGGTDAFAQFNPANPPNPSAKYKVTVRVEGTGGSASGSGQYAEYDRVYVRCSNNSGYTFSHWTKNGVKIDNGQSFTYYMETENVEFVAHFVYSPSNPSNPQAGLVKRVLSFESTPTGCCSYNQTNGAKWQVGKSVYVRAYPNQGYSFLGWYNGSQFVSSSLSFYYTMPDANTTLTAKFEYNPFNPSNPTTAPGQEDIDNEEEFIPGDINGDSKVDILDLTALISYLNGKIPEQFNEEAADVNNTGSISIADLTALSKLIVKQ